jgi:F0F1-type ATP synthase assembly protein I
MATKKENEYNARITGEFGAQIDSLADLNEQQKNYLKLRWLDQTIWLSNSANKARDNYYRVKRLTILSGVLIPVLVGSGFGNTLDQTLGTSLANFVDGLFQITAIILGLLIAASNGLNEFFKYHDRWQNYRTSSEFLKAEWWHFYSLTGRYEGMKHEKAFDDFAERAENILRQDLKTYVATIAKEGKKKSGGNEQIG